MDARCFSKSLGLLVILHTAAIAKDDDGWLMKAPTEVRRASSYILTGNFLCCSLAAPQILSVSAEGTEASGFKAVCHVQGSPLPDVQWIEPDGVQKGDTSFPLSQDTTGQYRDQATSTAKSSFSLLVLHLALALSTKLLLALGLGAWVIKRRFSVRASSVEH
uniref:Ig-like domain-containing protein n=1 Tax=Sinocyclocheilus anshuiensis TaxID=1608454 RepID=A0A671Q5B7_9TELE